MDRCPKLNDRINALNDINCLRYCWFNKEVENSSSNKHNHFNQIEFRSLLEEFQLNSIFYRAKQLKVIFIVFNQPQLH